LNRELGQHHRSQHRRTGRCSWFPQANIQVNAKIEAKSMKSPSAPMRSRSCGQVVPRWRASSGTWVSSAHPIRRPVRQRQAIDGPVITRDGPCKQALRYGHVKPWRHAQGPRIRWRRRMPSRQGPNLLSCPAPEGRRTPGLVIVYVPRCMVLGYTNAR